MALAPEGWLPLGLTTTALAATLWLAPAWSVPLWLLLGLLLYVFVERSPRVPAAPLGILSPVHGRVQAAEVAQDPWLDREALVIRVRMPFPGITTVHSPIEGKISDFFTNFGATEAATDSPTAYAQWVRTDEQEDVVVCVSTFKHSRFRAKVAPGERVGQGSPCGYVYFGAELALFLPAETHASVEPGDEVRAGTSIVANLVR